MLLMAATSDELPTDKSTSKYRRSVVWITWRPTLQTLRYGAAGGVSSRTASGMAKTRHRMWPVSDALSNGTSFLPGLKVMYALILSLIAINVAEFWLAFSVSEPCSFFDALNGVSEKCTNSEIDRLHNLRVWCFLLTLATTSFDLLSKLALIFKYRIKAMDPTSRLSTLRLKIFRKFFDTQVTADHWVVGASRSFFLETSIAVKETRALIVLLQLPTVVASWSWLSWG
eukprot:scaffold351741_cov27-Prasinocladus_malaysianus.AAC.1